MSTLLMRDNKSYPLTANVMVIDDQLTSRFIMESIVKSIGDNIRVNSFDNAIDALESAKSQPPDLIIVDYKMPEMNGVEFTRAIRSVPDCTDIPIIVFTIVDDKSIMYDALEAGATDFLTKPIDHYECKVRCKNLLTMRRQQIIIRERAATLEKFVHNTNLSILSREKEILTLINKATDFHHGHKGFHPFRIGIISMIIAKELELDSKFCEMIELAAPLHDIGEIRIPKNILLKPTDLTEQESELLKQHTYYGHELLRENTNPVLKLASIIALNHHERYDGTGYPNKLKGKNIPIEAQIVAIADAYDAMTSERVYRPPKHTGEAIEIILAERGKAFSPDCVDALIKRIDEITTIEKNIHNSF